ncbi:glutaredoxin family protein [Microbacterium sp. BG28]|nr:glutaredoxin family protein [Microbacterium sp. BG28]MDY0827839.1 glutaredoxin family protein [Microbacterium sp. BG28]
MRTITLIGKEGCHLCDVARGVIEHVLAELPDEAADRIQLEEKSILDDAALHRQWAEKIPVVLIDDDLHAYWRVNPERLRTAVEDATRPEGASL